MVTNLKVAVSLEDDEGAFTEVTSAAPRRAALAFFWEAGVLFWDPAASELSPQMRRIGGQVLDLQASHNRVAESRRASRGRDAPRKAALTRGGRRLHLAVDRGDQ
jgi:hypothetical protein